MRSRRRPQHNQRFSNDFSQRPQPSRPLYTRETACSRLDMLLRPLRPLRSDRVRSLFRRLVLQALAPHGPDRDLGGGRRHPSAFTGHHDGLGAPEGGRAGVGGSTDWSDLDVAER